MTKMWMVRAGANSFLIDEFIQNSIVAIGWNLGDLSDKSDDEIAQMFKNKYKNTRSLNQVIRFLRYISVGDYVVTANSLTRTYFIGRITSDYYRSNIITKMDSANDNYFDVRDVEWLGQIQRDSLKKSTQNALGANVTVYNIKDDAKDEILSVCNNNNASVKRSACVIRNYLDENDLGEFRQNDVEEVFIRFKEQFSPEILEGLEGEDIINKIFLHDSDKTTLCYNLEFSSEFMRGGIGGGSAFKYSLFKANKNHKWTTGSSQKQKTLSVSEAVEIGTKIRDAIVNGAKHIEKADLNSISDYIQLEIDLNNIFKECIVKPTSSWIHKYYVLIFPDKFQEIHGDAMKKDFLLKFRINPLDGYYANDGQFRQLADKANIKLYSLFDEHVARLFFKSRSIWDQISEGELVELEDCEEKPREWVEKRNVIYFGAPGTGKSYNLNRDKDSLLKSYEDNYERVTFHPDYSYANFVGTYKPVPEGSDITYRYVPGPFMRILKKALDKPSQPFILIIEEINRANVAAVFGDVFQILDRENNVSVYPIDATEDMKTYLNRDKIILPQNLFIWATMNSADQGVFPMDTAFKRRWDFKYFSINHNEDLIEDTYSVINEKSISWNDLRKAINDELLSYKINEDKLIGPFFAFNEYHNKEIPTEVFKDIFKNKIIMYLFEDAARSKRNELFSGVGKQRNLTYSEICEEFDKNGIDIFTDSIRENFITEGDDE
ncbi:MAG: AAA family ATPase [Methanosphaera sp.]|nr:AAA family ATPase [Methanosphaera sp.]